MRVAIEPARASDDPVHGNPFGGSMPRRIQLEPEGDRLRQVRGLANLIYVRTGLSTGTDETTSVIGRSTYITWSGQIVFCHDRSA